MADISDQAIKNAIKEYETMGRDAFLKKYGYQRSVVYFLKVNENLYDLKAIIGAARTIEFPNSGFLTYEEFTRELGVVKKKIEDLGYSIIRSTDEFTGFTQDSFIFLKELKENNNGRWISDNWARYEDLRDRLKILVSEIAAKYISKKYPFLETKPDTTHCLSRIVKLWNRPGDKYNTYLWAAFYRKTKNNKQSDFQLYFTIHDAYFKTGLCFGNWASEQLKNKFRESVRKKPEEFLRLTQALPKDFIFLLNSKVPSSSDLPQDSFSITDPPALERWLKSFNLEIVKIYDRNDPSVLSDQLVNRVIDDYKQLEPIYKIIVDACGEISEGEEDIDPELEEINEEKIDLPQFVETVDIGNKIKFSGHIMEDPIRIKLTHLIQNCNSTSWVLPRFQRYFDWKKQDIQSFLKSIFSDYYVGSLLLWKAGGEPEVETQAIKGVDKKDRLKSDLVILDGQQRVTSLHYAISAPSSKSFQDRSYWRDTRIYKDHPMFFYIDFHAYLEDPQTPEVIKVKSQKLGREDCFQLFWFPLYELEKYDDWIAEFEKYIRKQSSPELYDKIFDIKEIIRIRLSHMWTSYEIPYIVLPKSMGINQVTDIFEQLNTKGKPLNVFDLLVARMYTHNIKLKELWDATTSKYERIFRYSKQIEKIPIYILQAISLCYSESSSTKRSDILDLFKNVYEKNNDYKFEDHWTEISGYMDQALDKLERMRDGFGVKDEKEIPFESMIPVLASFLKLLDTQENKANCYEKIKSWYWSAAFTNAYSQSADSQMTVDYKEVKEWFNDDSKVPSSVIHMKDELNRLRLTEVKSKSNSKYKATMSLIALDGAKDFDTAQALENARFNDKDHIFPISSYKKYSNVNSVLNMTWMSDETNRYIKRYMNPSVYINKFVNEKYHGNREQFKQILKSHLINDEAINYLEKDDFNNFIIARENEIISKLEKWLGVTHTTPNANLISPETPFSNRKMFWGMLRECSGYIHWFDKYFSNVGFELISEAQLDPRRINEIKILMSSEKAEDGFRDLFKKFREEFRNRGIDVQIRVILDTQVKRESHDRWIISQDKVYNVPSPDTVARGQWSEIKVTPSRLPFMEWWEKSKDLIDDWNSIKENKR